MIDFKKAKAWVIAWEIDGVPDKGDALMTYDEAAAYCIRLNEEYLHMFHWPYYVGDEEDERQVL